jgi:hypothetical protein
MLAAFAVNLAYMELVRSELRTATDAAARAGGRSLSLSRDPAVAVAAAKEAASRNSVAGAPLLLDDKDIEFGTATRASDSVRFVYTSGGSRPNSMRVDGRLASDSLTGVLRLPFDGVFSQSHFGADQIAISTQIDRDITLVLDRSGSMAYAIDETYTGNPPRSAPDDWAWGDAAPPNSRWLDLASAVTAFLQKLEETPMAELVSAVSFASTSLVDQDLTSDYSLINSAVDTYTQNFEGGSTALGAGMDTGVKALAERGFDRTWVAKTLVIMTDGIHNKGVHPDQIIPRAQKYGITVHTITFSNEADQALMKSISSQCNGKHWHAPSGLELIEAFREIADHSPTLLTE